MSYDCVVLIKQPRFQNLELEFWYAREHTLYILQSFRSCRSLLSSNKRQTFRFHGLFQAFPFVWIRLDVTVVTAMPSAVTVTSKGSEDSSVMSCLSALDSQLATLLSVPEILFLRHRVFREYAKIAVGPDFIHTLPSFVIVVAVLLVLWKNPPSFAWLMDLVGIHFVTFVYKGFQVRDF